MRVESPLQSIVRTMGSYAAALFLCLCVTTAYAQEQKKSALPKEDEACLACHGQPGMKSEAGKDIAIRPDQHAGSAHGILDCRTCHSNINDFPHPTKRAKVECKTCHEEQSKATTKSVHGILGAAACASCHDSAHEIRPGAKAEPAKCAECHADEVKAFEASIHGQAAKKGDPDAPKCESCHGSIHSIQASTESRALVARKNQAGACASCHADPGFLSRHKIPLVHPVEQYLQSAHGRAVMQGKEAAVCADCHGSHRILPPQDAASQVSHWNVASTCGKCHTEIAKTFLESVHGQAIKAGVQDAPDCTACHGEHLILSPSDASSPVNAARVSSETCGRCHGDARLATRYGLPTDRVPSYAESYHGLAKREGSLRAANCASCHGIHNIFRSSDSRSMVNAANIGKTCGKCHEGMGDKAAIGPVHVQSAESTGHPVVRWIRGIYLVLIPLTLGFMLIHNALDLFAKMRRPRREHSDSEGGGRYVVRMNLWFRIAHWGVMVSFPTLVFTGFALKYPDSWWAKPLLLWEDHVAFRGGLHRIAGAVLLAATLYHAVHLAVNRRDRKFVGAMLPKVQDIKDLLAMIFYNLGLRKDAPTFGKFNYAEKLEYWAFLWGTAIMAVSGFLLWFNDFTLRHFAKWTTDAATAVHWYEALLATFSILLWHLYLVIFDPLVYPMETAWIDGKVPAEHYKTSRPEYLKALEQAGMVRDSTEARDKRSANDDEKGPSES